MADICILGLSGAGKTVFISVLTSRFREIRDGEPYFAFKNAGTNLYVATVWDKLTRDREWPDSTPPGTRRVLEWILHTPDGNEHALHVLDAPGQDVAAVFSADDATELSPNQRELASRIESAGCVVWLINLLEIRLANSAAERANYESAVVVGILRLLARRVRVAVLIAQHDRLKANLYSGIGFVSDDESAEKTLKTETAGVSPLDVIRESLPSAYAVLKSRIEKRDPLVYLDFVSAVADTETVRDADGTLRSRPAENFSSYGLAEALAWISSSVEGIERENKAAVRIATKTHVRGNAYHIGFAKATRRLYARMFNFSGRATRSEFWKGLSVSITVFCLLRFVSAETSLEVALSLLLLLPFVVVIPLFALTVRRAHDMGVSLFRFLRIGGGIVLLIVLLGMIFDDIFKSEVIFSSVSIVLVICVFGIFLIALCLCDSDVGRNKYGDSEKYPDDARA